MFQKQPSFLLLCLVETGRMLLEKAVNDFVNFNLSLEYLRDP